MGFPTPFSLECPVGGRDPERTGGGTITVLLRTRARWIPSMLEKRDPWVAGGEKSALVPPFTETL